MSAPSLETANERDPLTKDSRRPGYRYVNSQQKEFGGYHSIAEGSRWTLCACGKILKFVTLRGAMKRNSRKRHRWAIK